MKFLHSILNILFFILKFLLPDEFLLRKISFKNQFTKKFLIYKINSDLSKIELNKQGLQYWKTRKALFYFIYAKNNNIINTNTQKILNNLFTEIKNFNDETKYLEIGCGYPIYLKSPYLKEKIKHYYGYDINPYISAFFNINNIFNLYPNKEKYDVVLVLSGVIKYYLDEELNNFLEILNNVGAKKIIISHDLDYKIIKDKMFQLDTNEKFKNLRSIEIINI